MAVYSTKLLQRGSLVRHCRFTLLLNVPDSQPLGMDFWYIIFHRSARDAVATKKTHEFTHKGHWGCFLSLPVASLRLRRGSGWSAHPIGVTLLWAKILKSWRRFNRVSTYHNQLNLNIWIQMFPGYSASSLQTGYTDPDHLLYYSHVVWTSPLTQRRYSLGDQEKTDECQVLSLDRQM